MRGVVVALVQIFGAAVAIAVIGGLIGLVVVHFAHWGGASEGFGWGMVVAGVLAASVGNSGSPSQNRYRGRLYPRGLSGFNALTRSVPMPQSPLQVALGGLLSFAGGIGVFFLVGS